LKGEIKNKMECKHCGNKEGVYLFAVLNGKEIYDCPECHKRTEKTNDDFKPLNIVK